VLLFFSLALVLNVSASSAASVNQTNISAAATSLDDMTANISTSNYATADNAATSDTGIKCATANTTNTTNLNDTITANSSNKSVTNTTETPNLNNTQAAGAPVLVNGLTVAQLKDGTSRVQAFFNANNRLPTFVSFGTRQIPIATFIKNIATQGLKINTVIVNGLNVAQLKDGISRVQAYYVKYGKLPTYISFGTRHIPIATFEKNIASIGLKITTQAVVKPDTSSVAALAKSLKGSTSYITAVNLFNWVRDNIGYSFYYNTKYGAAGTLTHMTGNCCDTANLLVALARADGITSRYVHGYCDFSSGWYGHVWAQLYVNGKWYTADATSYSNSLGVVKNWNTATYTQYGVYNTLPF
jgi:Transglutaminase-like superfamily/Pseudomurein-binding repeat